MSRLVSRLLLTVLMLPLGSMVYLVALVYYIRSTRYYYSYSGFSMRSSEMAHVCAGLVAWMFVAVYWLLLWRQTVVWTQRRVWQTGWLVLGAILAGMIIAALVWPLERTIGAFVGSACAPLLWVVGTIFAWRETPAESAQRLGAVARRTGGGGIVCPSCGYNLTGLREARCPECGTQYTLDELFAAQPSRAAAEIETT
jgi:hypothetical protein